MLVLSAVQIYAKKDCEETLYTPRFTKTSTQAQNLFTRNKTRLIQPEAWVMMTNSGTHSQQ